MLLTDESQLRKFAVKHRLWQGIPSIERTKKGRTFISFYSGKTSETFGNYEILLKSDDLKNFGDPVAVAYSGKNCRCFDGVLWIDPLGRLWFLWNVQPENMVYAAICDDPDSDELVWSKEFCVGEGVIMNRPTVLSSGEWLFPIAVWKKELHSALRGKNTCKSAAYVYKTVDDGKTFTRMGGASVRGRVFDEHMILELNNKVLKMLVRTNYGIGESYSYDRGKNWTSGQDSGYGGPNSRFHIRRLASGRILLINHYKFTGRNNITALLSEDEGKTFKYSLLLDERANIAYPDAVEGEDGFIYVVYDRERGSYRTSLEEVYKDAREILIAKFTENDIVNGKIISEGSRLKIVASKLGKLDENDADPFEKNRISDSELAEKLINAKKENAVRKIFELYSFNCINIRDYDAQKLDRLISEFKASGSCDKQLLAQIIGFVRKVPAEKKEVIPIIEKVTDYIGKNLNEDITVNLLAEHTGISVYYLSHLFKSVTGTTIIKYRNELRLTKAKIMLINSDDTVNDIAHSVGFCSGAYFTKIFSKLEKITPTEYRKLNKR